MLPLYLRLDGMVVATAPTDDSNWIQIEEAARIIREHNERKAREEQDDAPITLNDVRPTVRQFALEMELKLRQKDHRGKEGWRDATWRQMWEKLREELVEVKQELMPAMRQSAEYGAPSFLNLAAEAVNLANMAMMIHDNATRAAETQDQPIPYVPTETADGPLVTLPGSGPHLAQAVQEIQEGARKWPDIIPDPTGEGSAWQPTRAAPGSDAEHPPEVKIDVRQWEVGVDGHARLVPAEFPLPAAPVEEDTLPARMAAPPRQNTPMKVLRSIAGIRLDGEPDEDGQDSEMDIDDAFRLLSDVVESAREVLASPSVKLAPADQRDQLPDYQHLGQQNRDLDRAARMIVDLEEERNALRDRLATAEANAARWHDALVARHGGEPIALLRELDAERARVEKLTAHVGVLEGAIRRWIRARTTAGSSQDLRDAEQILRAALSATDEGRA